MLGKCLECITGLTSPSLCCSVLYWFVSLAVKCISSFLWSVSMIFYFFFKQNLFRLVPLPTAIASFCEHSAGKCSSYLNWKKLELKIHAVCLRDHLGGLDKICILIVSIWYHSDPNSHPPCCLWLLVSQTRQSDFRSINESVTLTAESVPCNCAFFGAVRMTALCGRTLLIQMFECFTL